MREVARRRVREDEVEAADRDGHEQPRSAPVALLALQRSAGNAAVTRMLQRQFDDEGKSGDGPLDIDLEREEHGPAGAPETDTPVPAQTTEDGEWDGEILTSVHPCAFTNQGRVGEGKWHHCGGTGGMGNQNTGHADLVAPRYVSSPPGKDGQARAWVEDDTGTVKVKRSYNGVPVGAQGDFTQPPPGKVWMTSGAAKRVDKHEVAHVKKTKELHDQHIKPLEARIAKRRKKLIGNKPKEAATEQQAKDDLKAEIDWNTAVQAFSTDDTTWNAPMAQVDIDDMAEPDFYSDYGTVKVKGVDYTAYHDVPPGPKQKKAKK